MKKKRASKTLEELRVLGGKARAKALSPERRREIALAAASKGGKARLKKTTRKQRKDIAKKAALARWGKRGKAPEEKGAPKRAR